MTELEVFELLTHSIGWGVFLGFFFSILKRIFTNSF